MSSQETDVSQIDLEAALDSHAMLLRALGSIYKSPPVEYPEDTPVRESIEVNFSLKAKQTGPRTFTIQPGMVEVEGYPAIPWTSITQDGAPASLIHVIPNDKSTWYLWMNVIPVTKSVAGTSYPQGVEVFEGDATALAAAALDSTQRQYMVQRLVIYVTLAIPEGETEYAITAIKNYACGNIDVSPTDSDEAVRVDSGDYVSGYLDGKLVAGTRITFSKSAGPNKALTINADAFPTDSDEKVKIDAADSAAGYLVDKLLQGYGISLTPSVGPLKTMTAAVAITIAKTWDGQPQRPLQRRGTVWVLDAANITLAQGILTFPMIQECVPMYDIAGYAPINAEVQFSSPIGSDPYLITFSDGIVVNPGIWAGTTIQGINPSNGSPVQVDIDGATGLLNDALTSNPYTGEIRTVDRNSDQSQLLRIEAGVLKG